MDFPRNASTNVHKIVIVVGHQALTVLTGVQGGILFIQWSVYGLGTTTDPSSGQNRESTKQTFDTLHAAEYELRRSGNHVLHDQSQGVLWIFDLSGPSVRKEPRADYLGGIPALLEHYNLRKLLFGSLRASDMVDIPTPSHEPLFLLGFWLHLGQTLDPSYLDSEFRLAPFGTVATQYYQDLGDNESVEEDEETIESNEESRLQRLKPSVSSLLEQHGLQLSEHCAWLRVNIKSPVNNPSGKRSDALSSDTIVWPAHLCFYEDNKYTVGKDIPSWLWPGLEEGATDPLKAAEIWFLGKEMREKAIDQKRLDTEAELSVKRQGMPLDDDDLLSAGFQPIDRHIDIQGAIGIYPTPPDGFQAQHLGNASDRAPYDQANVHNDTEMLDPVEGQHNVLEQTDQQSGLDTEIGMSLGAYGDIEDDDLFGDMDSAMFTAKGITEDDFDFFDEPEELNSYVRSTSDLDPTKKTELAAGPAAEQAPLAEPSHRTHIGMELDEPQSTAELEAVSVLQSTREDGVHVQPETVRNQRTPQLSPQSTKDNFEHHDMSMPTRDTSPTRHTTSQHEQSSGDHLSVFGSMPLWKASRNLDQKYEDRGRFSIDTGKLKSVLHHEKDRVERSIPLLSQLARNNDEFESDEDNGTNEPRTPNSITAYNDYEAFTDNNKNQVPQTPSSPVDINTKSETPPALLQMSSGTNSIPHDSSLQSISAELTQQVYCGHDGKYIQVAQILADQLLAYSKADSYDEFFPELGAPNSCVGVPIEDPLRRILGGLFPCDEICTLEACASLFEVPRGNGPLPKTVARPVQRKQGSVRGLHDVPSCPFITSLVIPNIRVTRGDTLMDISSTALEFWEELGLSPCVGSKDVAAFCIYPQTEMVHRGSASFMKLASSTFQSLRLGAYSCGSETLKEFPGGLVPVALTAHDIEGAMQEIDAVCEYLGEKLSQLACARETIIVYMVNPFCPMYSLPRLCECFLRCFEKYVSSTIVNSHAKPSDLVLKLLPISWVASTTTIALSSPKEYIRLVKDVYDRCPANNSERGLSPYASASLVQIAEDIPKTVNFSLAAEPTMCLTQENEAVHVGYSWDFDSEWLSSSITDNFGRLQWNASYSLGDTVLDPWPAFTLIIQEIWKGLIEMIGQRKQQFHVYVAKDTPIDQREVDVSTSLDDASYTATPESTLLANASTPENLASPGFVGGSTSRVTDLLDTDSSLRLLNIMDQTWAVTFSGALYTRSNGAVAKRYLGSGYLTKRAGKIDENGWVMMGVHVVHAEKWKERCMKDLLGMYGSLGTIARARGVENEITSVLPWHIAVASRAQKGLNMMMRYDNGGSRI
ncbi:mediator of RNA polymerase II transcription subunit 13 [Xylographa bjoerkii]|nr:mediator of RNA polymerase II transcription subunit 13 [Xylographa bjoerkii]